MTRKEVRRAIDESDEDLARLMAETRAMALRAMLLESEMRYRQQWAVVMGLVAAAAGACSGALAFWQSGSPLVVTILVALSAAVLLTAIATWISVRATLAALRTLHQTLEASLTRADLALRYPA